MSNKAPFHAKVIEPVTGKILVDQNVNYNGVIIIKDKYPKHRYNVVITPLK